jgi:hypothetical protein
MRARACVWAAAHQVSDNRMASVGGDVAGDDWDDFGIAAPGLHAMEVLLDPSRRIYGI